MFSSEYCKIFKSIYFQIICKRLLLPLEVFCKRNLLILAMRMLHLACTPLEVLCIRNLLIFSYENASFDIQEDSIWLQLIYFLTTIAFWPRKYLFRILRNCVVFTNQPLWKIHGVAKINFDCFAIDESNQVKISSVFMQCQGYFLKIALGTRLEICRNPSFAEHHRTTASGYSSINSSEGRLGKLNHK